MNKQKTIKSIFILLCILVLIFLVGCKDKGSMIGPSADQDFQAILNAVIEGEGSLIAVYKSNTQVNSGAQFPNYVLIQNAYDKKTKFNVALDCEECNIDLQDQTIEIEAYGQKLIKFNVVGNLEPGLYQETIKVTDSGNNFYTQAEINILVK